MGGTDSNSHSELPGYEAAHEVESPPNRPVVEMQGESGDLGRNGDEEAGRGGMHEMGS